MKLYLASYRIPNPDKLFKLFSKPPEKIKVALIPNAKDYYAKRARDYKLKEITEFLKSIGLNSTIVDLANYTSKEKLKNNLSKYDFIWVSGGNTFCLRYQMKRSGFDKIIFDLLNSGIVYGGDSAGALITGPTLKGVEKADVPEFSEDIIWEGLNIINKIILPHADNLMFKDSTAIFRKLHGKKPNYIELKDSEDLVIDDN